jgi:hypothetical protein
MNIDNPSTEIGVAVLPAQEAAWITQTQYAAWVKPLVAQ